MGGKLRYRWIKRGMHGTPAVDRMSRAEQTGSGRDFIFSPSLFSTNNVHCTDSQATQCDLPAVPTIIATDWYLLI